MNENIKVVNIKEKLTLFNELWSPKIIGDLNDSHVKVAKVNLPGIIMKMNFFLSSKGIF